MSVSDEFKALVGIGNTKLGDTPWQFSIPAITTCPGRTKLCSDLCYADEGRFVMPATKKKYSNACAASKQSNFADRMIKILQYKYEKAKNKDILFRIHVSGDFYSAEYAKKWLKIIQAFPKITFWAYTRSWRVAEIVPVLKTIAKQPNCLLWYSTDSETGKPKNIPKGVRTAYLQVDHKDIANWQPDLYFRDEKCGTEDGMPVKYVNGSLVCPAKNSASYSFGQMTCDRCKICLTDIDVPKRDFKKTKIPLEMVAA